MIKNNILTPRLFFSVINSGEVSCEKSKGCIITNTKYGDTELVLGLVWNYTCISFIWKYQCFSVSGRHSWYCLITWYGLMHEENGGSNRSITLFLTSTRMITLREHTIGGSFQKESYENNWCFVMEVIRWNILPSSPQTKNTGIFMLTSLIEKKLELLGA